jgi:hypothetical protein
MARPQKNNLNYFSHDVDMRNDIKIKALRRKFGHTGYSIYVMMLEHLGNCEYLQYKWDDLSIELLTPDLDIDSDELKKIINYCVFLELFYLELNILYCPNLFERNKKLITDRSSYNPKNSPLQKLKQDLLSKSEENYVFPKESTQSKVKESKVKENKTKESKLNENKVNESIAEIIKSNENKTKETIEDEIVQIVMQLGFIKNDLTNEANETRCELEQKKYQLEKELSQIK